MNLVLIQEEDAYRFERPDIEIEISGEVVQSRQATGDLGIVFILSVLGIACIIAIMLGVDSTFAGRCPGAISSVTS